LEQQQIHEQPRRATVSVDEGMNRHELVMRLRREFHRVQIGASHFFQNIGHQRRHFERVRQDHHRAGNSNGDGAIPTSIGVVDSMEDGRMEVQDGVLGDVRCG
jgi:hypothetical protein